MFHFTLINPPDIAIKKAIIQRIFEWIEQESGDACNGILNIAFVSDEEIQRLNRDYRSIDSVTDVLSFHYFDDFSDRKKDEIVGEIVLNSSRIHSQAIEYNETPEAEFYKLVIHSWLHILGYDHEEEEDYEIMREIEKRIEQTLEEEFEIVIH